MDDFQKKIGEKVDNFLNDLPDQEEEEEIKRPPERLIQAARAERREERIRDLEAMERTQKKKSNAPLIIGILVALLAIVAVVAILVLGNKGKINIKPAESSETESTTALEITCNVKDGGEYTAPLSIELKANGDCRIFYSLDGERPSNRSERFNQPIEITSEDIEGSEKEYTFWAVVYNDTGMLLDEYKATFKVKSAALKTPVISPGGGPYTSAAMISISADSGATIYYTTDGTVPTSESPVYTRAFAMEKGEHTVQAIAYKGDLSSSVATMTYTLKLAPIISQADAETKLWLYLEYNGIIQKDEPTEATTEEETKTEETGTETTKEEETTLGKDLKYLTCIDTADINGNTYYVFKLEVYDSKGNEKISGFYGVDDQSADIVPLYEVDGGYAIP